MSMVRTRRIPITTAMSTAPALLSIALGAALLAACHRGSTAAPLATAAPPAAATKTTSTTALPTTTTTSAAAPATSTSTAAVSRRSQPSTTEKLAAIAGTYYGGTADQGWLYIRADGASRYRYPDENACQCTTASAPIANIDFSLTKLVATPGGAGHYRATGRITAESDPTTAKQLAGPTGSSVMVTIGPGGSAMVSFLPSNVILQI